MARRPSIEHLPAELARAARAVAEGLRLGGRRAWLVGGAVRDLALGVAPHDADLASAALPEELERLFPRTYAVGKAFGTVVVHCEGLAVQVTTFRAESGYDDARRPSHVRFANSLEEDAERRDFTCNALYLDPLTDELRDPTGGLADLEHGRLRCVGDAALRFTEDGLRLLRLARLAAQYGLEIEPGTASAARSALEALRGVSPERVLAELERMAAGRAPARSLAILLELGVLPRLAGLGALAGPEVGQRVAVLERLAPGGTRRFFATLLWAPQAADEQQALQVLGALRPPRALLEGVPRVWNAVRELEGCLQALGGPAVPRSRWMRLARAAEFEDAWAAWRAWQPGSFEREAAELRARIGALAPEDLRPAPLVTSRELASSGIPRGPRWAQLLRAAEDAQLDGELRTREDALAWLARQLSA
ncbi:MAG: CCA tRNA nucleotidyltransferase [Planctomycetes bacterium]|nr:CCA tRNA nucleotidyltransferase [Planctomycetota bacterium]